MKTASRTLVKSPPEVWEQLDDAGRMQGLMSALVGHAAEVEVYARVEESKLAWKANDARIEIELAEKGWGTNVSVSAERAHEPTKLEGWLDAVLDELATPQKRPFADMGEPSKAPTVPTLAEAPPVEAPVEDEPAPEPTAPDEEEPPPEPPAVETPPAEAPAPEPAKKKRRRFFGF